MNEKRLQRRLDKRKRRRDRQEKKFHETHQRGHAFAVRKEAKAVRFLKKLLGKARRHKKRNPDVMFDSVTVGEIPGNAHAVLCYTGGDYHTCPEVRKKFGKHVHILTCAISADEDAMLLDVENGDATPEQCADWYYRQQRRGSDWIGFYASVSVMQRIINLLKAAGIQRHQYKILTAHYAGKHICGPHTCAYPGFEDEANGCQWTSSSHGRNLDESFLASGFFD